MLQGPASAKGCAIEKLDRIVENAIPRFGFADAPIEVVKVTGESFINGFGQCAARFTETVRIDIGEGVVLTARNGELRQMDDCE